MPQRFRKKPVEIEAVQLTWETWSEMCEFAPVGVDGCRGGYVSPDGKWSDVAGDRMGLLIPTLEGDMLAVEGDWVIRGIKGEFYPCKPDIFAATYDAVES